jgi:hypothetical protein
MVDLSLILDVSGSIASKWGAVRDASRAFVNSFDQSHDRLSLLTYSNGAKVLYAMPASRGFAKATVVNAIPQNLPGGSTAMVEGLYRGWDEIRTVPRGQQSSLRIIVLFTDGASNSVPGFYDSATVAKGLRTYDFPKHNPDPDGQTWNNPAIQGLYDTDTGNASPAPSVQGPAGSTTWNNTCAMGNNGYACLTGTNPAVLWLPVGTQSAHTHHRSGGIPTSFPLQTNTLTVNGVPQDQKRPLRNFNAGNNRYPAEIFNINNAARNLVEIVANAARSDNSGDYPIRIYTIGMGELVQYDLGTTRELSEDILKRIANDKRSPDYNRNQLDGMYYFARTEADVAPAFQALQNQIIKLTK